MASESGDGTVMRRRRPALERAVRARLELTPKERVLAWVDDGSGRAVVASDTALHVQRLPPDYSRFGWEQIERRLVRRGVADGRAVCRPRRSDVCRSPSAMDATCRWRCVTVSLRRVLSTDSLRSTVSSGVRIVGTTCSQRETSRGGLTSTLNSPTILRLVSTLLRLLAEVRAEVDGD